MLRFMIGFFDGIIRGEFLLFFLEENFLVLVELERFEVTLLEVLSCF